MSMLQFTVPPLPHYMLCGPSHYAPGGRHVSRRNVGVFDLLFVREGCLYMAEEDRTFEVGEGCALILRPDRYHYGTKGCEVPTSYYWLHFQTTGSWAATDGEPPRHGEEAYDEKRTQALWSYATHTFPIHVPQFARLSQPGKAEELFEQLVKLNQSFYSGSAKWSQQSVFQELLRQLSASAAKDESTPAAACADQAAAYLRKHYREPVTAQELGERLNFHPVYIARCMQRYYGCPPMEYLLRHRIEQAKLLLLQTDHPVARVAEEVGFNQAAYFTSCFTRAEGLSPRKFRQRFAYG
ncbi:AraC-like ligand binding domain-containing protein [Paenibacillus sp. UNC496MF]|uniref:helix-turn-helix transcriptional regulator n=1 Tax=Paenibacillus sp. UNC496MF TaxID=1502753 RepID=UPI0008E148AA|nr:AraC family transcriptional regulator [Paenibacillus sp. UNC496MF]SFI72809.1 AraC-like ligand binding domain-containing protein [Paenibacillus sp. UNC496MF]